MTPTGLQFTSVASLWEMAIKMAIGKLTLRAGAFPDFARQLDVNDTTLLPVGRDDALRVATLPVGPHKDPFDRLIAAQRLRLDLTLVSVDAAFDAHGVRRAW